MVANGEDPPALRALVARSARRADHRFLRSDLELAPGLAAFQLSSPRASALGDGRFSGFNVFFAQLKNTRLMLKKA